MNKGFLWMSAAASGLMIAWVGCGGSGGGSGASGGAGTTSTTKTTTTTTGTGGSSAVGGSGGADPNPFECTVPATPPSAGSCVTTVAANDAGTGIECNPVTNEGCTNGDTCDTNDDDNGNLIGFTCYPGPNIATICTSCVTNFCGPGTTCFELDQAGNQAVCVQYCCTDADCGTGTCSIMNGSSPQFAPVANNLGVCTLM